MQTEFVHPNGERLEFTKTSLETNGELLEMEAVCHPNSQPPALPYHPQQKEIFEVLQGTFRVTIGDTEHRFEPGDTFTIPAKTVHSMNNISDETGCLRWQIRPALKSQDFFATMWGLAADGKTTEAGLPDFLQLMVILKEYHNEFRAVSPPRWFQMILFNLFAPIGRWRGYQARYEEYSGKA